MKTKAARKRRLQGQCRQQLMAAAAAAAGYSRRFEYSAPF